MHWNFVKKVYSNCQPKKLIFGFSGIWTRLAKVNTRVKFLSRHVEVFKIYTKYLPCLVYNRLHNIFVCTLWPYLSSFRKLKMRQTTTKLPWARCVARFVTSLLEVPLRDSRFFCYIRWLTGNQGMPLLCHCNKLTTQIFKLDSISITYL